MAIQCSVSVRNAAIQWPRLALQRCIQVAEVEILFHRLFELVPDQQ